MKLLGEEISSTELSYLVIGAVVVVCIMVGVWLLALNSGYAMAAIG